MGRNGSKKKKMFQEGGSSLFQCSVSQIGLGKTQVTVDKWRGEDQTLIG